MMQITAPTTPHPHVPHHTSVISHMISHDFTFPMRAQVTFVMLSKAIARIEMNVRQAERVYRMVLQVTDK